MGTPNEEQAVNGTFSIRADDGFKYIVTYTGDNSGILLFIDMLPIKRIPPNALKTLVG